MNNWATDIQSCLLELTNTGIAVERRALFTRTYDEDVTKWISLLQ